jgi:hypothetical protein
MKIFHHVGMRLDSEEEREKFIELGVNLPRGKLTSFDIDEDDPRWEQIGLLVSECKYPTFDTVTTEFSTLELEAAKFLGMIACSNRGFPQPAEDQGYLSVTYDLTERCTHCGLGKRQIHPFRMRTSPGLRSNSVLQLNWVFDEYFVTPETWDTVFKPFGIGCRPVLLHKTGTELQSVVQLTIQEVCDLKLDGAKHEECPGCFRRKHPFVTRGFFPKPAVSSASIFKSSEWFGEFGFKLVIVSSRLYRAIEKAGLIGIKFYPCAE